MIKKEKIIEILQQCYDPEIPIDLWNLGLIYEISINKNKIDILMTLTTPGCSMAQFMADDIKSKIENLNEELEVKVNVTFDPPWEPSMMTDKGKEILGFGENKTKKEEPNWE